MSERRLCTDPDCDHVAYRGSPTGAKYLRAHYVDEHKPNDLKFRMVCNVVNLSGEKRYDLNAVMGEIERLQELARRASP